jgi:hypothetical protein
VVVHEHDGRSAADLRYELPRRANLLNPATFTWKLAGFVARAKTH